MGLSRTQRRVLTAYRQYHEDGEPRLSSFFGTAYRTSMAAGVVIVAACVTALIYLGWPILAAFLVGVLVGRLLNDLRYYWSTKAAWPAVDAVVDWERLHEMLVHTP